MQDEMKRSLLLRFCLLALPATQESLECTGNQLWRESWGSTSMTQGDREEDLPAG